MIITGICRIGRDCELRCTPDGDAVTNLSLAFNYGKKDQQTGNKPTMWIEGSLWGKRAEALAPWLLKGTQVSIVAEDPHIETYEGKNGPGSRLVARIMSIDFAGPPPDRQGDGGQRQAPQQGQQRQAPQGQQGGQRGGYAQPQQRQQGGRDVGYSNTHSVPPQRADSGFSDMNDDIPF